MYQLQKHGIKFQKQQVNMARVKVINGKPVIFNKLPEVWQGINGHYLNFDKMSEDIWLENEFFELKLPEYNPENQKLVNLYFNEVEKFYTYKVKDLDVPGSTLKSSKENKIKQLKQNGYQLLLPTDWYVIREVAEKKSIPDKIKEQRKAIYDSINKKEAEINSLNTIKKVEEFDITI